MVRAQAMLLDYMGIERLRAVMGGSMGGMQVLSWHSLFPDRVEAATVIASTARHSAQHIDFHEVGRQAIMDDPRWRGGDYYHVGDAPTDRQSAVSGKRVSVGADLVGRRSIRKTKTHTVP